MNYFDPKNLTQLEVTYSYTTLSGVGFAIGKDGDRVYLNARMVDTFHLDVGDTVRVWAVDNYSSPDTMHFPSRWRAVRVEVLSRLDDSLSSAPVLAPAAPVAPVAPAALAPAESDEAMTLLDYILDAIDDEVPITARAIAEDVTANGYVHNGKTDLTIAVNNKLQALHARGEVALLKIYSRADKDAAAVYYGKTIHVLRDHLDTPLAGDQ
jgi:hypothetical protein